MIIKDIAASLPSKIVSNDEVIDIIKSNSKNFQGDLEKTLKLIKVLMEKSGLETRRWCDYRYESPMDHIAVAVNKALSQSYLKPHQIDLFIYVGIGKGFIEPGNSYMAAKALGFNNAECFDVTDACMSWMRALSIIDSLFKTNNKYKNAIVVNGEFNIKEYGLFSISDRNQLDYLLPTFTIGEAASACLLSPKEPDNFNFKFHSKPELTDLCTIPLPNYQEFCHPTDEVAKNGIMKFTSFGFELHEHLDCELPKVFKKDLKKDIDIVFTHASSKSAWSKYGEKAGISDKIYHIYQDTGNLVSASVPVAISIAKDNEKLRRGDKVLSWVGSAGMSFGSAYFTF